MPARVARIDGEITIDLSDYAEDIVIYADEDEIEEIMDGNNISIEDMMTHFDISPKRETAKEDVNRYITDADYEEVVSIINACLNRLTSDYSDAVSNMAEIRRELYAKGGFGDVEKVRSSC